MSFAKALNESQKRGGGKGQRFCMISEFAESMDDQDYADFEAALANPLVSTRQITRALNSDDVGIPISMNTILKHRNRKCACFTDEVSY